MNTKRVCMTILALLSVTILTAMGFSSEVAAENKAKTTNEQKPNIKTLSPEEVAMNANKLLLRISADIDTGQRYNDALESASAEDSLGNFAAGVMILFYRPYDVGDFVDVGGVFGTVDKMSLVSTSLLTIDNQLYIVPNSKIWGDVT